MSNSETQIIQIVNDISCNMRIVTVLNCPINWLLLCDIQTNTLFIFDLTEINSVFESQEFEQQLVYKIPNFNYEDTQTYFMDSNNIYYTERGVGTLIEIDIEDGTKKEYDFGLKIKDLLVIEGRSVYYKCSTEQIYFVDLDWVFIKDS